MTQIDQRGDDEEKQRPLEDHGFTDDSEDDDLLPPKKREQQNERQPKNSFVSSLIWMIINTLATIGIVFTNKAIFSNPSLKLAQLTFAAFHFFITWLTLFVISRPCLALFTPRRTPLRDILPLSVAMSLNVILPNLSLAFSSVTFYQVARILLTPTVAVLNYLLHGATLPRSAILALVPTCAGVGLVSYYDSQPTTSTSTITIQTTSPLGVAFAFAGVLASSLYTVWIASHLRALRLQAAQLLLNQAPVAALLLLYAIPFVDTFPSAAASSPSSSSGCRTGAEVGGTARCGVLPAVVVGLLIAASGLLAALINISQFFIVARTGPVSSTVVGHVKTCAIVALGWVVSGRPVRDRTAVGVVVAIGGIIAYSIIMLRDKAKQTERQGRR
ncbi:hypothetical protein VTK56DRAFT_5349 [Thermocarpiscus australiensis]